MIYEKTIQDNTCSIKNLDTNVLNIKVYFNKYYHDNIDDSTDFNDYVLISEHNLQSNQATTILLNEDGDYNIVLFDETLNSIDTINVQRYVNYRMSMIKDFFIAFNQRGNKFYNKIGIEDYPRNLQDILNEHISIESIMNYAFLNNYFNNDYFTAYLQEAYKQYKFLFIPDTLGQRQYLNLMGKYNMKYNLIPKMASIFIVGFYLMELYSNTDITLNNTYSIHKLKRGLHKLGLTFETLQNIFYINAPILEEDPNTPITATVITNTASNITQTSVSLNGLTNPDGHIIAERGFEWKKASSDTYNTVVSTSINNIFSVDIKNLSVGTAYIFKAYIKVNEVTIYGNEITFNTNNVIIIPPIAITNSVASITQTSATINGIIIPRSEIITSQGFQWRVSGVLSWTNINLVEASISHSLTNLLMNTDYEFRSFATTTSGTVYGDIVTFTTLNIIPPTVNTNSPSGITQTSTTFNGSYIQGTEVILAIGFEYKLNSTSNWIDVPVGSITTPFTATILTLTNNSNYIVRAYTVTESNGRVYGIIQNFTTLISVPPTVVTSPATAISQNTATLNGTVTVGSGAIIVQGFEWKLSSASTWTAITTTINGNAITHNLTGLTSNTAYQYRAYATTNTGTVYGTTQNFIILDEDTVAPIEINTTYYGTLDTDIDITKEQIINQNNTESLTFTTNEIEKKINFIAFPATLSLISVENAVFTGDFWYNDNNDLYTKKIIMEINGENYNIYSMFTFMPVGVKANVKLAII